MKAEGQLTALFRVAVVYGQQYAELVTTTTNAHLTFYIY